MPTGTMEFVMPTRNYVMTYAYKELNMIQSICYMKYTKGNMSRGNYDNKYAYIELYMI